MRCQKKRIGQFQVVIPRETALRLLQLKTGLKQPWKGNYMP